MFSRRQSEAGDSEVVSESTVECRKGQVPMRFHIAMLIFSGCWMVYMLRVNMSVNILAMVPQRQEESSQSSICTSQSKLDNATHSLPHKDISDVRLAQEIESSTAPFNWTENVQALVLASYFWGMPISSLFAGTMAEQWGPTKIVFISTMSSAVLTALVPIVARAHYSLLIIDRFLLGLAAGLPYPAFHVLVARWSPPAEKGKFVSALQGGTLGTVFTWSISGPIITSMGWDWAFYVTAIIAGLWSVLWWYTVADSPLVHKYISEAERKYIADALGDKVKSSNKVLPPYRKVLTSLPFLAFIVLHFGNVWGLYFVMTVGPKFVSNVLGFNLSSAGAISALPYLARLLFSLIFGVIGDCLMEKHVMTTTTIRKSFTFFSHMLPGFLLVALMYSGCSTSLSVTLITLSMGFNGAATLTNLQNHQDLAPNFAGTLYGIANFVGATSGFITPVVTAAFIKDGGGLSAWLPPFYIGAAVYILSAVFFVIFGTAEMQPWNDIPDTTEVSKEENKKVDAADTVNIAMKEKEGV